ncbi:MAG: family 43 glycosylhydrolase [Phaeodactylibacter sp.]|nr:family 43 glycosylhydrolase [Phaeodactylibacter sp.]
MIEVKQITLSFFMIFSIASISAQIKVVDQSDSTVNGQRYPYAECVILSMEPLPNKPAKAPLYRDPVQDGAADPVVIWHREEQLWYMIYTVRRANVNTEGFAWVFGSDIGIATSKDGRRWLYRGTIEFNFERGHNTYWAPEVIYHQGTYHMYLSFHHGIPDNWWSGGKIVHLTSNNLWDWKFQSYLPLNSNAVIDACVAPMPDDTWRMWYKDRCSGQHTWAVDSENLYDWKVTGEVIADEPHEGPNVFYWKGYYWMITDPWRGLGVYRSDDAKSWKKQGYILNQPGLRTDDKQIGQHADVVVTSEDRAYIFYHVHPGGNPMNWQGELPYEVRRSSIQVAELEYENGSLFCDRNKDFDLILSPPTVK